VPKKSVAEKERERGRKLLEDALTRLDFHPEPSDSQGVLWIYHGTDSYRKLFRYRLLKHWAVLEGEYVGKRPDNEPEYAATGRIPYRQVDWMTTGLESL
jgi:hypothetical protein